VPELPKIEMSGLSTPQLRRLLENSRNAGRHGVADQVAKELERRGRVAHTLVSSSFAPGSIILEPREDAAPEVAPARQRAWVAGVGVALILGLVAAPAWFVYEHGLPGFREPASPPAKTTPRADMALLPAPAAPVAAPTETPVAHPAGREERKLASASIGPRPAPRLARAGATQAPVARPRTLSADDPAFAGRIEIARAEGPDEDRIDLTDSQAALAASGRRPAVRCDGQGSPAERAICDDAERLAADRRLTTPFATTLRSDTLSVGRTPPDPGKP